MATPVGPYTPAVRAGDLVFVSGQIGVDKANELLDGFGAQTRQALGNLQAVLEESGLGLRNVVKVTVFLTDMSNYAEMNEIYSEAFGDTKPARAAIAVAALPKDALFEVEAVAHAG